MPQKKSFKQKKMKQKQKQSQSQKVNQKVIVNIDTNKNKTRRVYNKKTINTKSNIIPNNYNIPNLIVERPTDKYNTFLNELIKTNNKLTEQTGLHKKNALVDSIEKTDNKLIQQTDLYKTNTLVDNIQQTDDQQTDLHKTNTLVDNMQQTDDQPIDIQDMYSDNNTLDDVINPMKNNTNILPKKDFFITPQLTKKDNNKKQNNIVSDTDSYSSYDVPIIIKDDKGKPINLETPILAHVSSQSKKKAKIFDDWNDNFFNKTLIPFELKTDTTLLDSLNITPNKDEEKKDDEKKDDEKIKQFNENRKNFYEKKQDEINEINNKINEMKVKRNKYNNIITELEKYEGNQISTQNELRQQVNDILYYFNKSKNIRNLKDKNKIIAFLKENIVFIDNKIKKEEKSRIPPKTSGNIINIRSDAGLESNTNRPIFI